MGFFLFRAECQSKFVFIHTRRLSNIMWLNRRNSFLCSNVDGEWISPFWLTEVEQRLHGGHSRLFKPWYIVACLPDGGRRFHCATDGPFNDPCCKSSLGFLVLTVWPYQYSFPNCFYYLAVDPNRKVVISSAGSVNWRRLRKSFVAVANSFCDHACAIW